MSYKMFYIRVLAILKFFFRIFYVLTWLFRKTTVKQRKIVTNSKNNCLMENQLKCEGRLRRCLKNLPESQLQQIYQQLQYIQLVHRSDLYNSRETNYYQNDSMTLRGKYNENMMFNYNRNSIIEDLKTISTRSKQSNQLSGKQEITPDLRIVMQAVKKQAKTIEKYEKFCSELLLNVISVVGQQHDSRFQSLAREFLSQTLHNAIKIASLLGGDGHETDNCRMDSETMSKLQMSSETVQDVSTQNSSTQTDAIDDDRRNFSSVGHSIGVQTESCLAGESVGVQTDSSEIGESVSVQAYSIVHSMIGVQTNTLYYQTVGSQTNFDKVDSKETNNTMINQKYSSNIDIVTELLEKFGHDTRMKTSRYNLKTVLGKVQTHGFQSLLYNELTFLHRSILTQSAKYFIKYIPLLELAKKKFPSLKSNTIQYKYDIVHIFATLDMVLSIKNKELALIRDNSTKKLDEETQKRVTAENKVLEVMAENAWLSKKNK